MTLARYDCETISKPCVAAGCDRGNEAGLSLHKFTKNPLTRDQWYREIAKTRFDQTEPSKHSRLCSLHFTKDSYETSVLLAQEMGLPSKKRRLKETDIPTLFQKATEVRAGSMEWACGSIHCCTPEATVSSSSTTRPAVVKRPKAPVCKYCMMMNGTYTYIVSCNIIFLYIYIYHITYYYTISQLPTFILF